MPDFWTIADMLSIGGRDGYSESQMIAQGDKLRSWLAAQPLAPEGGDCVRFVVPEHATASVIKTAEDIAAMDSVTDFIGTRPEFTREGMFEAFGLRTGVGVQQTRGPESNDPRMDGRTTTTPPASGEVVGVQEVSNLLAVIHGDGGHYQHEHGTAKAATDALAKYNAIKQQIAEAAPKQAMGGALERIQQMQHDLAYEAARRLSERPTATKERKQEPTDE